MRLPLSIGKEALLRVARPSVPARNSSAGSFWSVKNFENLQGQWEDTAKAAKKGTTLWRNLTLFVCLPLIGVYTVYCIKHEQEEHHKPRKEFVGYEHLRIRKSKFPWGDGNHGLFHNKVKNALPDGYEVEDPMAGH